MWLKVAQLPQRCSLIHILSSVTSLDQGRIERRFLHLVPLSFHPYLRYIHPPVFRCPYLIIHPQSTLSIWYLIIFWLNRSRPLLTAFEPQVRRFSLQRLSYRASPRMQTTKDSTIQYSPASGHLGPVFVDPDPDVHSKNPERCSIRDNTQTDSTTVVGTLHHPSASDPRMTRNVRLSVEKVAGSNFHPGSTVETVSDKASKHLVLDGLLSAWRYVVNPPASSVDLVYLLSAISIVSSTVALCALSWRSSSIAVLRPPNICGPPGLPHRALCETLWQVLNLFHCLRVWSRAPGRLNDLRSWYLWRCIRDVSVSRNAILKLAAKHTTWFRLHRSSVLANSNRLHGEPSGLDVLPGEQNAPSTALWKMDVIVWLNVLELMFQCGTDFFM